MLPAALATAPRCQPRALRYWRRAAAPRSPGRPGLTRRPSAVQPGNVVPTRSHGADYRSRSISWVFALSKMRLDFIPPCQCDWSSQRLGPTTNLLCAPAEGASVFRNRGTPRLLLHWRPCWGGDASDRWQGSWYLSLLIR